MDNSSTNADEAAHACASYKINELQRRISELEKCVVQSSSQKLCTPSRTEEHSRIPCTKPLPSPDLSVQAYYLDSELWSSCRFPDYAKTNIFAPEQISRILGSQFDIDVMKTHYFESIHTWMPIVSKIRLNRLVQRTEGPCKADIALLLLCMKLVQEVTHEQQTEPSELYVIAKQFSSELELKGILTLRMVQAGLLLSVYELGHGIFPAAFTTISYCARQGVALGLHNKSAPQFLGGPRSWVEWEERQRVWWMVVILDRYVTVGAGHRPLCTEDPSKDTILPADDGAWDSGEIVPPERVCLSSLTGSVSSFARLAQASNLLGRVIRHCNDTALELEFVLDNYEMLCQTLYSLVELLSHDFTTTIETSIASTICFSALLKLSNYHSCNLFNEEGQYLEHNAAPRIRECMQRCFQINKDICGRVVSFAQGLSQSLTQPAMQRVSPLVLHCIYDCTANLSWMTLETDNAQYAAGKLVCENILRSVNGRWRTAGVYLELLRIGDMAQDESN
ncbi:fungal specific transcription factor domain-containing protein [Aspergillus chevalieri]|uniref:Xylanolytic transcriptional activator regulatory domain-containing protein n=1 Tax=Aspergillus chevalieri TaxID=182096 RepID=A0A7R7VRP0_ASPCH|nr:uncharacterized protein ACHE_50775S [Aspergillus chevalieri]BCR89577.1 hypothetical protein ACHE_50775S [Aspergillus chevalieri]